ncbi:dynein regulatory complex subunit 6 [Scleropages formosus]|uniref:dynein regulatory complex subunit 6 n=1 Tax=Scleropages formosus TaxID=113540 RepID=UPI0010FA974C|nr:dynein regulatory complex subunit 6 [Scleropages formosus]
MTIIENGIYDRQLLLTSGQSKAVSSLAGNFMSHIFGTPEDGMVLSHLYQKAYMCYIKNLTTMCFKAWTQFILSRRKAAALLALKMSAAKEHHEQKMLRTALRRWMNWVQVRRYMLQEAIKKIRSVYHGILCKMVFHAWRYVAQDSRETKEYFERLEKGPVDMRSNDSSTPHWHGKDGVSMLPWKIALKIFQCLSFGDLVRCMLVCPTWRAIAHTPCLWSQINFSSEKHHIADGTVVQILQKYRPFVVHLNMRGCSSLRWPSFRCVGECRNLQELNLSECSGADDESVRVILEGCPALLYLNLSHTPITDSTLRSLSRCCVNLQCLSLACCRRFTDRGLRYLAAGKGCRKLLHLDLSGCAQITAEGFDHVAAGCDLLRRVELNDVPTLSDQCVTALLSKCRSLHTVSLLDTPRLSDAAFKAIAEGCELRRIRVEGNGRMTDASWSSFCRKCPGLKRVHVADCPQLSDGSLRCLGSLKDLTSLSIAACKRVSNVGLKRLLDGPCGPRLQELNLSRCFRVRDVSLVRLAERCLKLKSLSLCYCERLTDSGFERLGDLSSLASLDLTGTNVQDEGLTALGSLSSLKQLSLSECLGITDVGIQKLCRLAPGLESMDVSHCLSLSDQAVKGLSFYCRGLVAFRMQGCPEMTDRAVQYLTATSQFLHLLDVSGCVRLTDRSAVLLRRGCRQLRSISMLYCPNISKHAALSLQPHASHWEHSRDDVPLWYGYDSQGLLLPPMKHPSLPEEA